MRKISLLLLLATTVALASTHRTNETLVGASATALPARSARGSIEIQNLGPDPIYCALGESSQAVVGKARMVAADGGTWLLPIPAGVAVYCVTTVAQVTTKATVTTEIE